MPVSTMKFDAHVLGSYYGGFLFSMQYVWPKLEYFRCGSMLTNSLIRNAGAFFPIYYSLSNSLMSTLASLFFTFLCTLCFLFGRYLFYAATMSHSYYALP